MKEIPEITEKARKMTEIEKWWMEKYIRINDRETEKLVPFKLNCLQEDFAYKLNYQRAMGHPVMVQLLKPRKVGFSTYVAARYYMHALLESNLDCVIVAHKDKSTKYLFKMQKTMHTCMPEELMRETVKDSRMEIEFAHPHRSYLQTMTAAGDEIGRGLNLNRAHFSEYHFWPWETSFISALNAISQGLYFEVILESTANGANGSSYDLWKDAERHRQENPDDWNCWQDVFYSWLEVPWYREDIPEGYEWGQETKEEYELRKLGADPEQLYWRRLLLPIRCKNDPDYFKQEYPATRDEAFLYSQGAVFNEEIIHPHMDSVKYAEQNNPGQKAQFVWADPEKTKVIHVPTDEPFSWTIWREPEELGDYVIGADPTGHAQSDPNEPRSQRDWDCAAVRDRRRHDYPATYRGRFGSKDEFGEELLKAAIYYHDAWIVPEVNVGDAILIPLKRYPNLYVREGQQEDIEQRMMGKYGWKTTLQNRGAMIDNWKVACRMENGLHDEKVKIYDPICLSEEQSFVYNKQGKAEHAPGCHDDMLFAHMLANEGHHRLPMGHSDWHYDYGHEYIPEYGALYDGCSDPGVDLMRDYGEEEYIFPEIL